MTATSPIVPIWAPADAPGQRDLDLAVRIRAVASSRGSALGAGTESAGADRVGIVVHARDSGSGWVWMLDARSGSLEILRRAEGRLAAEARLPGGVSSASRAVWELGLRLRGHRVTTLLDGEEIDEHELPEREPAERGGGVGIDSPVGARSVVESVRAVLPDGTVVIDDGGSRWSLGVGAVRDGALHVAEGATALAGSSGDWALLRGRVELPEDVRVVRATLTVAADDPRPARQFVHRTFLNGREVAIGPATPVRDEVRSASVDVTGLVRGGTNTLSAVAWAQRGQRFRAELIVEDERGGRHVSGTSADWEAFPAAGVIGVAGSIGTAYYAAPAENVDVGRWPRGLHDVDVDEPGWVPVRVRPPFERVEPATTPVLTAGIRVPASERHLPGGARILDLGGTVVGGVRIRSRRSEPGEVRIRYAELPRADGLPRVPLHTGNDQDETWRLPAGASEHSTWGWRVFRYLRIDGLGEGDRVDALEHRIPAEGRRPSVAHPDLDRVLELCADTIRSATGDLLVDARSRERAPYEADAWLHARALAVLTGDPSIPEHTLAVLLESRTWPTEWPFYLALLARDLLLRTGRPELVEPHYDRVRSVLPERWIDPSTGLVRKTAGVDGSSSRMDHDLVDWPPAERDGHVFGPVNTVVNAIAHAAYRSMAELAEALEHPADAAEAGARADALADGARRLLWDDAAGAFADGLAEDGTRIAHHSAHSTAFAVAFGLCPEELAPRAADGLAARGMAVSVYAAPFLLASLIRAGRTDDAVALMTADGNRSWTGMIRQGGGATFEAWNPEVKPNLSCAHPWGASPLFLVAEEIVGIRPITPGYATFEIRPRLGSLSDVTVEIPTPAGVLSVVVRTEGSRRVFETRVPTGLRGVLVLPDGAHPLGEGVETREV